MEARKHTILLVDDDDALNYLHQRLLDISKFGNPVVTLENGKDALDAFLEMSKSLNEKDLVTVFLDINMPVMDGWEFLKELKKMEHLLNFKHQIFMLSSSINPDDIEKAEDDSLVTKYISKPLSLGLLEEIKKDNMFL
ncbi:response regulator [Flavobacterium sp. SUN046]|uniref:response regulator n=1 Tax=Flavobacterium sp. SUN046 TaxID=3002440 RepID=UPI002DB62395|nr:response regulator [Flavobacterium sp. SUN046]MEC4050350.1 response regulator [Flavobacterium sp. SUN046]